MTKVAKSDGSVAKRAFAHDCVACIFVGQADGEDLYACELSAEGSRRLFLERCGCARDTRGFARRFGNDPDECGSLPADCLPEGSLLSLAAKLWKMRLAAHAKGEMFIPRVYKTYEV